MPTPRSEPATERSTWHAHELAKDESWQHTLSGSEIQELSLATRTAARQGLKVGEFDRDDFPLPSLGAKIAALVEQVENGRGVGLLRGIPVDEHEAENVRVMYWGLGVHAGIPISQNSKGQLLAEVSDKGNDYGNVNTRGFATNAELLPHVDTSDMTTLLCLRAAVSGGESRVISSSAVFNTVLAEQPEYLDTLFRGFHNDLRGEGPTGDINELTNNRVPVFSDYQGRLSCSFNYRMIDSASKKSGIALTPLERAAIDFVRAVSLRDELMYRFAMRAGDMQMVSNHSVFHSRSTFVDHEDPERRRALLRFWINMREGRALEPDFAARYNTGPRGGVAVGDGARYSF